MAVGFVNNILNPIGKKLIDPRGESPLEIETREGGITIRRSPPLPYPDGSSIAEAVDAQTTRSASNDTHAPTKVLAQDAAKTLKTANTPAPVRDDTSLPWDVSNWREKAWKGDPHAQLNMVVYCQGEERVEEAALWLRRAAEQGLVQAQFNLGVYCQNGIGVKTDLTEAVKWYESAAAQGYVNAIYNLAFMHENGLGCPRDPQASFRLYQEGANCGEPDSQCKLAILLLDESLQKRVGYPSRSGSRTHAGLLSRIAQSLFSLRRGPTRSILANGWIDIPVDHEKAKDLLTQAAKNGHPHSTKILRDLGWN